MINRHLQVLGFVMVVVGWSASAAETPDVFSPLLSTEHYLVDIVVNADGTSTETIEDATKYLQDGAVKGLSYDRIDYAPSRESIKIIDAYTITAKGIKIKVPAKSIKTEDAQAGGGSTFNDSKTKVILYPQTDVGSIVVHKYVQKTFKTLYPGVFIFSNRFSRHLPWQDVRITLTYDNKLPIFIEMRGMEGGKVPSPAGTTRYQYTYKNSTAVENEDAEVDDAEFSPIFNASSLSSHVERGNLYQKDAQPKMRVTPDIQKKADALTQGITDRRAQVEAIYQWAVTNIRYVSDIVGRGGFVPHAADQVLANGYGDCKDITTLMGALLKAKGIESSPVLINSGDAYTLPAVATLMNAMQREKFRYGMVTMCIGTGMGAAGIFERVE